MRRSVANSPSSRSTPYCSRHRWSAGRCRPRRGCGAPTPTHAPRRPCDDLVMKRVEQSPGIGLGHPVKRALQLSDLVYPGGPSHHRGTHQALPCTSRVNEAAALPSPTVVLSARLDRYYGRLRLPPSRRQLPGSTPVIRRRFPRLSAGRFVRGGPLQFPPPPSERSAPSYAGESLAAALQDLRRFHGLRREPPGSALSSVSNDAAGFASATDRSVAPLQGLSTLGSDPPRFQNGPPACYRAPWRLPGPDFHRQATTSF